MAAGLCPDPLGELKRSPRLPSRNKGCLLLKGGKRRIEKGKEGKGKEDGKGEEGKGRDGKKAGAPR